METVLNPIGLDHQTGKELGKQLNTLLANYQVFYSNVRGFHWNIKGEKFFELHLKFEELYNNLQMKIDEVAERILTLGETPLHTYTDYLAESQIQEVRNVQEGRHAMEEVVKSLQHLLILQRALLKTSGDANDEGTNALMSDYVREQEKMVWMFSAYLK